MVALDGTILMLLGAGSLTKQEEPDTNGRVNKIRGVPLAAKHPNCAAHVLPVEASCCCA